MFKALTDALTRPMSAAKTNLHLMPDSELNVFVKDMPPAKPSVQATTPLDRTLTDIQMPKQSREQRQQDNFVTDGQIFKTPERPSSTAVKPLVLVPEEVPVPAQEHKSAQQQAMWEPFADFSDSKTGEVYDKGYREPMLSIHETRAQFAK